MIFSAEKSNGIGAVYMHDTRRNTITHVQDSVPYAAYVGDSVVYIISRTSTGTSATVRNLKNDMTINYRASFTDCPGSNSSNPSFYVLNNLELSTNTYMGGPKVNKSRDLIWVEMASNSSFKFGTKAIKKFTYSTGSIETKSSSFLSSGLCQQLSGDTFLLVNSVFDTKNMTTISTISFVGDFDGNPPFYFNGKIFYNSKVPDYTSFKIDLRVIDLNSGRDIMLVNKKYGPALFVDASFRFFGTNNGNLLFGVGGPNSSIFSLGNGTFQQSSLISFNHLSGTFSEEGKVRYPYTPDKLVHPTIDNKGRLLGGFYTGVPGKNPNTSETHTYTYCVNGTSPFYSLGYWYSSN
jgi:hypothetical protein